MHSAHQGLESVIPQLHVIPEVGSSRNKSNCGLLANSTPIVTRLRCSTDNPAPLDPIIASAMSSISNNLMIFSTYSYFSSLGTSVGCLSNAENRRASRTVEVGS